MNVHSTSIPFVIPWMCLNRIAGLVSSTDISESHHVGQFNRRGSRNRVAMVNGLYADISTTPPPSDRRSRNFTYR